ncbi:MAG: hypothetical protein HYW88_02690 [Candidatus Sungbacteria bacterium]|nr:hypothetical protein [Candidatus Sungbacteria bacterium]
MSPQASTSALPDYTKWKHQKTISCALGQNKALTISVFAIVDTVSTADKVAGRAVVLFFSDKKILIVLSGPPEKEGSEMAVINGDGALINLDLKIPEDETKMDALFEKAFKNEFGPTAIELLDAGCQNQMNELDRFIRSIAESSSK